MAAVVNSGSNPYETYSINNDFFIIITSDLIIPISRFKFRIRVSYYTNSGTYPTSTLVKNIAYEIDVDTVNGASVVNPLQYLRDGYMAFNNASGFKDAVIQNGFCKVEWEVGEVYASADDEPATFKGYDTSDSALFYNGYKDTNEANVVNTEFQNAGLNPIKSSVICIDRDNPKNLILSAFSYSYFTEEATPRGNLKFFYYERFDASGTQIGLPTQVQINDDTAFEGWLGIYTYLFDYTAVDTNAYIEYRWGYEDDGVGGITYTAPKRIQYCDCLPNTDLFYLNFINSYGVYEMLTFYGRVEEMEEIQIGKKVYSPGINNAATTIADIKSVFKPNYSFFGSNRMKKWTVKTGYIEQEKIEILKEMLSSPLNIFTYKGIDFPVLLDNNSFDLVDNKYGVQELEFNLTLANKLPILQ